MTSTAPNTKAPATPSPFLSLSPAHLARLQPHTYVYAHLNPSPDISRPSIRINGRTESQFRPASVNTGSLSHTNGSAVVRIGDTTAVCGVRGEILSTHDIPAWKVSNNGAGSSWGSPQKRNQDHDAEDEDYDEDDSEIHAFNLLVPNLSLSTGCSPSILPGSAPSSLAQSLSHQLLSLLHSSRLIRASDLRIWSNPNPTQAPSQEQSEDIDMEDTPAFTDSVGAPELKAFWTLYIDVLIISHAGNSFAVFEADPVGDWRKVIIPLQDGEPKEKDQTSADDGDAARRKRWILADPDAFEESLCQERVCIVVDKDGKKPGCMKILMMEKGGGFYVGKSEIKGLVELASVRWEEWRALLEGVR
ncbi:hypothetical protein CIHG_09654 [Coccidioides immitis H538.4]|uniref:Ribosomal RNA-processing protein 43 n=1 Tax=Coccidioides immitis H538.4 TaxID=396776 RepID=A0A0J8S4P8_COCIT|nr:hypothetical protein CIHG_09654 [Coccidioides immitis H538.4]